MDKITPLEQECVNKLLVILRSQDERLKSAVGVYLDLLYRRIIRNPRKSAKSFKYLYQILERLSFLLLVGADRLVG